MTLADKLAAQRLYELVEQAQRAAAALAEDLNVGGRIAEQLSVNLMLSCETAAALLAVVSAELSA